VLDTEDYPAVKNDRLFLLSRCKLYFKRELPPDHWRLFMGTAHPNLPSRRFRQQRHYREMVAKMRPLPIGLPIESRGLLPMEAQKKTADVFFAGDTESSSTVRTAGMRELTALRERGITVDIPPSRLPLPEFYQRAARAWLVWSPEGLGWDCFRHYEALACGAVPVINQPTVERHRPLIAGEHAFYYDSTPGELTRIIVAALADKERLRAIARAGEAHVMAHHTPDALARYVIETTLDSGGNVPVI
jgi:glycosyltransferase involved in cell wall biosynthesis